MPPANTPRNLSPDATRTPNILGPAPSPPPYLSTPPPEPIYPLDLAEPNDAEEENLRFLRRPWDSSDQAPALTIPSSRRMTEDEASEARRLRLTRQLDSLSARRRSGFNDVTESPAGSRGQVDGQTRRTPQENQERMQRVLARLNRFDAQGRPIERQQQQQQQQQRPRHTEESLARVMRQAERDLDEVLAPLAADLAPEAAARRAWHEEVTDEDAEESEDEQDSEHDHEDQQAQAVDPAEERRRAENAARIREDYGPQLRLLEQHDATRIRLAREEQERWAVQLQARQVARVSAMAHRGTTNAQESTLSSVSTSGDSERYRSTFGRVSAQDLERMRERQQESIDHRRSTMQENLDHTALPSSERRRETLDDVEEQQAQTRAEIDTQDREMQSLLDRQARMRQRVIDLQRRATRTEEIRQLMRPTTDGLSGASSRQRFELSADARNVDPRLMEMSQGRTSSEARAEEGVIIAPSESEEDSEVELGAARPSTTDDRDQHHRPRQEARERYQQSRREGFRSNASWTSSAGYADRELLGNQPARDSMREAVAELRRENPFMAPELIDIMARSRVDQEREIDAAAQQRLERDRSEMQLNSSRPDAGSQTQESMPSSAAILADLESAEREVHDLERRLDAQQNRIQSTQNRVADTGRRVESLRSTAMVQNATSRSAEDPSADTTERMLRYIRDREQVGGRTEPDNQPHDSSLLSRWSRMSRGIEFTEPDGDAVMTDAPDDGRVSGSLWNRQRHQNVDRYRREYLSPHPSHRHHHQAKSAQQLVSPFLENAVTYLDRIRTAQSYDEMLTAAIDTGFASKEFFADKHDDFLMDVTRLAAPSMSSWLQPGVTFSGSQHTTALAGEERTTYQPYNAQETSVATFRQADDDPNHMILGTPSTYGRVRFQTSPLERWPVKMTVHSVDVEAMTMSGTMEAYDVPNINTTAEGRNVPITTYVEGQIIDLQKHSFLTPSSPDQKPSRPHIWTTMTTTQTAPRPFSPQICFPHTTAAIDASNWRRLPPFADIKHDDEVARTMLSQERMAPVNEKYIFMRWKERCFIHKPGDRCPQSPQVRRSGTAGVGTPALSVTGLEQSRHAPLVPSDSGLGALRYVAETNFSQPIPRFPRPNPSEQPVITVPASTEARLSATPAPPSTSPGPGPNIIAHISQAPPETQASNSITATTSISLDGSTAPPTANVTNDIAPATATGSSERPRRAIARLSTRRAVNASQPPRTSATRSNDTLHGSNPVTTSWPGSTSTVLGEGDDTDTGHGLTISGFYYVSLDRLTGELMGLYFDPSTSPYQCLKLKGEAAGRGGSWQFA